MSNMSYCRFENTTKDMWECIDALEEADWNMDSLKLDASEYEQPAMDRFIKLCRRVVKVMGETDEQT
jgi:hypothetical protein